MPQDDAKYVGLGLLIESLVTGLGSFRTLAQTQAAQLQEKDGQIRALQAALAAKQEQEAKPDA